MCSLRTLRLIRSEVRVKPQRTQRTQRFGNRTVFCLSLYCSSGGLAVTREFSESVRFPAQRNVAHCRKSACGRFSLSSELPTRKAFEGLDFGSLSRTSCSKSDGSSA